MICYEATDSTFRKGGAKHIRKVYILIYSNIFENISLTK